MPRQLPRNYQYKFRIFRVTDKGAGTKKLLCVAGAKTPVGAKASTKNKNASNKAALCFPLGAELHIENSYCDEYEGLRFDPRPEISEVANMLKDEGYKLDIPAKQPKAWAYFAITLDAGNKGAAQETEIRDRFLAKIAEKRKEEGAYSKVHVACNLSSQHHE